MDLLLPVPGKLSPYPHIGSFYTLSPLSFRSFTHRRTRSRAICCSPKPVLVEANSNCKNANDTVEVFGIGSRKDALLDFCLASPCLSPALRFWNILVKDSDKVLLQEKSPTGDVSSTSVEVTSAINSHSKAVILVASAAYGTDHLSALDILTRLNPKNGLVVGIILKPFSFEGRRRYDEVNNLIDKLRKHLTVCIVIDTDGLLKKDLLTLDEALKTSYNAVLMAVNVVPVLMSEDYIKLLDVPDSGTKELSGLELIKILESYKEAKTGFGFGFGAGYNIETSILRAVYDCPFLGLGVKGSNGVIICVIASSGVVNSRDVGSILHTFRQTTGYDGDIVISIMQEPNTEPNLIVTTLVTCGYTPQESSKKSSLFSRLAQHIPFIFNILKKPDPPLQTTEESKINESPEISDIAESVSMDNSPTDVSVYSEELQELFRTDSEETSFSRDFNSFSDARKIELSNSDPSSMFDVSTDAPLVLKRELLTTWNLEPGSATSEAQGTDNLEVNDMFDNISTYKLPVGVKNKEQLQFNHPGSFNSRNYTGRNSEESKIPQPRDISSLSDRADEEYNEIMADAYNSNPPSTERNYASFPKRKGGLSSRAASMLEAERDSKKKWIPVVEMKYGGGVYRGRIEGGLPEGKGCLSLEDGSKYDGMWRYGKKSGLGTFYFNNGDIYRGSWRDDLMHGKGWFYFHTGDRWFVNFWKGKANGEGRFYSKLGDVFFGHFKDGWRHGRSLCINIDGTRSIEVWDEGILQSRKNLDSDAATG